MSWQERAEKGKAGKSSMGPQGQVTPDTPKKRSKADKKGLDEFRQASQPAPGLPKMKGGGKKVAMHN